MHLYRHNLLFSSYTLLLKMFRIILNTRQNNKIKINLYLHRTNNFTTILFNNSPTNKTRSTLLKYHLSIIPSINNTRTIRHNNFTNKMESISNTLNRTLTRHILSLTELIFFRINSLREILALIFFRK